MNKSGSIMFPIMMAILALCVLVNGIMAHRQNHDNRADDAPCHVDDCGKKP